MAGYYGNPWQTDGLNNSKIGPSGTIADFMERSPHTGTLTSVDLYVKVDTPGGYSGGTGGSWTVRCETDSAGQPSGTLISAGATVTAATPVAGGSLVQRFTFGTAIPDILGTLRHFRITNADASPTVNFVSLNQMDLSNLVPTPLQPTYADADRQYMSSTGGAFAIDRQRYPIVAYNYADGSSWGVSYYDALSGSGQREIGSGGRMVRMNFTPAATQVVNAAHARVYKSNVATAAALSFNLRNLTAGGTLLDSTSFSAASVALGSTGSGYGARYKDWAFVSAPVTLTAGVNYSFEMASTEVTNPYISFPSRVGGFAGFGLNFDSNDRFLDGYWEYTTDGVTWLTHPVGTIEQQMQLFFDVADTSIQRSLAAWSTRSGGR